MVVRASDGDWTPAVLGFWFREVQPAAWFKADPAVDGEIRLRFGHLWEDLRVVEPGALARGAKEALAAVIALDQFPRNMFRDRPEAFASDARARAVARGAVALGYDRLLRRDERVFLYLPYEHSEDAADQARSVELIGRLGSPEWTRYAHAHKAVIDRFGRFPHRNIALGRASTADEIAFLQTAGRGF